MKLRFAAQTDLGKVRKANEDSYIADDRLHLFGVADGIGGLPHGAEASKLALLRLSQVLSEEPEGVVFGEAQLVNAAEEACLAVFKEGLRLSPSRGIGSTMTVGHLGSNSLQLAHVGDSRCYLWRQGKVQQITIDHNVESDPRFNYRRTMEPAIFERQKAALTRCMGQSEPLEVEYHHVPLQAGDRVLFCTDGVYRQLTGAELQTALQGDGDPASTVEGMLALANLRGGVDNATAVLLLLG